MSYQPLRVAPGRFVGRGFATERAKNKLMSRPTMNVEGASIGWTSSVVLFKELGLSDKPALTVSDQEQHPVF